MAFEPDVRPGESLSAALLRTLRESRLEGPVLESAELALDATLQSGLLREIPVLGFLTGVPDAARRVRDLHLERTIVKFLMGFGSLSMKERSRMVERLEHEPDFASRVGERLTGILLRLDDSEKAVLVGRAFKAYAEGNVSGYILTRLVTALDRIDLIDLNRLASYHRGKDVGTLTMQAFVSVGFAHVPHGMATVHYVELLELTVPMLRYVLIEAVD